MKQFTVPMALADYIPVVLFLLASVTLVKDLKQKMNKTALLLFFGGISLVFAAGCLKATYKLLYALHAGDFLWLNNQFFFNQSFGFLMAGVGLMMFVMGKDGHSYVFFPTMALVGVMVVGLGAMDAGLCFIASRMKKRNALICFVVSFFLCLCMGYLSSRDFDRAFMNWIAQIINIFGQGFFYLGTQILDKAGLSGY